MNPYISTVHIFVCTCMYVDRYAMISAVFDVDDGYNSEICHSDDGDGKVINNSDDNYENDNNEDDNNDNYSDGYGDNSYGKDGDNDNDDHDDKNGECNHVYYGHADVSVIVRTTVEIIIVMSIIIVLKFTVMSMITACI